jgi:putative CocE/NonD family hydrolase
LIATKDERFIEALFDPASQVLLSILQSRLPNLIGGKCIAMSKSKALSLTAFLLSIGFLILPGKSVESRAQLELLVDESTHFIQVPAGSFGPGTITLAATVYQPRFFPSAPAAIYIHGWGGHRLTGTDNLGYYIAAAGYIVVSYTARGFGHGESGGRVTLAGPDELEDLRHVIDWLTTDPDHVIGPKVTKIGVLGGSYGGGHSFQISSDPRVSAVIPLVGWTDLEQALYPNGAIKYKLGLAEFYSGLDQQVGQPPFYNYSQLQFDLFDAAANGRGPDDTLRQTLRARSIASMNSDGEEVLDQSRQPRVPTYIIQSWDDYLFPVTQVLDVYSQITAPKQIYLGRHGHPPGGNRYEGEDLYIATQVLSWFDHYLRGLGGTDSLPVTSAPAPFDVVPFAAKQFSSDSITSLPLFLKPGGVLSRKKKGPIAEETAGGIFRPERIRSSRRGTEIPSQSDMSSGHADAIEATPQRLVYTFAPFETQTEMLGPDEYALFVSASTPDVDLIVRTFDVAPDGTETEITVGVVRVTGLAAGEIRRVTFRDFGDDWLFAAGHSLRLKVTNIDFPDFRPPGANDNVPSTFTIHTGRGQPSVIALPLRARL